MQTLDTADNRTVSSRAAVPAGPPGAAYYLFVFNFDGVLADSARLYLELCRNALTACGHTRQLPSLEDLVRSQTLDAEGLADTFALTAQQRSRFCSTFNASLQRIAVQCDLYPGIALTLRTLASTAYTAVVSRSDPSFVATVLRANGVPNSINRTLGVDRGNPVDCIRQLLQELCIAPSRAIYCGDCVHDLHVARLAGVQSAACTWGWQQRELEHHSLDGVRRFDRPAQMLTALSAPHQRQPDLVL